MRLLSAFIHQDPLTQRPARDGLLHITPLRAPRPARKVLLPLRGPRAAASSPEVPDANNQIEGCLTVEEVQRIAARRGLSITVKTLGPFYRITCREGDEKGKILGATSGFVVPMLGLMHCDMLQIFTKGLKGEEGARVRGGPLGLGLLIGATTFAFGRAAGCRKAEILAINDDEVTYARLVRYYNYFGFEPVYEVTGGRLADLPHMLVWGGAGMRMDADVERMEERWRRAVRRSTRGQAGSAAAGSAAAAGPAAAATTVVGAGGKPPDDQR